MLQEELRALPVVEEHSTRGQKKSVLAVFRRTATFCLYQAPLPDSGLLMLLSPSNTPQELLLEISPGQELASQ
jgi:hypothetical protein